MINVRTVATANIGKIPGTNKSLNLTRETTTEVFIYPASFSLQVTDNNRLYLTGGLYISSQGTMEVGFFDLYTSTVGAIGQNSCDNSLDATFFGPVLNSGMGFDLPFNLTFNIAKLENGGPMPGKSRFPIVYSCVAALISVLLGCAAVPEKPAKNGDPDNNHWPGPNTVQDSWGYWEGMLGQWYIGDKTVELTSRVMGYDGEPDHAATYLITSASATSISATLETYSGSFNPASALSITATSRGSSAYRIEFPNDNTWEGDTIAKAVGRESTFRGTLAVPEGTNGTRRPRVLGLGGAGVIVKALRVTDGTGWRTIDLFRREDGSAGYTPIEQFEGCATTRADLYGAAATVLFLLTHREPADFPVKDKKIDFSSTVEASPRLSCVLSNWLEPDGEKRTISESDALALLRGEIAIPGLTVVAAASVSLPMGSRNRVSESDGMLTITIPATAAGIELLPLAGFTYREKPFFRTKEPRVPLSEIDRCVLEKSGFGMAGSEPKLCRITAGVKRLSFGSNLTGRELDWLAERINVFGRKG